MLPHPSPAVSIGGGLSSYAYPPQVGSCQDVESRLLKICGSEPTSTLSRLPEPPSVSAVGSSCSCQRPPGVIVPAPSATWNCTFHRARRSRGWPLCSPHQHGLTGSRR